MVTKFGLAITAHLQGKGLKDLKKQIDDVTKKAKASTNALNNALGGKRIENSTKSLATNLGAVGNRLGFMAFQWKFMAGAAEQALGTIFNGLKRILDTGSKINTSIGQALAFSTGIQGIKNTTEQARKEMALFQAEIVRLGSGLTIFNRGEIADIGKTLVKSFGDPQIAIEALNLARQIKQLDTTIDNEKLSTGLVTLFEATDVNLGGGIEESTRRIQEMTNAVDFLTNVSDKSSLNFQSTIASFSKAAPLAKALGLEATELGTIIQVAGDVLGRNKSSGRAGSSAGTFTNAFLSDLSSIADETTKQGKAARDELLFGEGGFNIFESDGKTFLPLTREAGEAGETIQSVFQKAFKDLPAAVRAAKLSKLGLGDNSKLIANALIFDKTTEELREMRDELRETGTLMVRAATSVQDTGSQMKRFQAAISGVQAAFTAGLAPILKELADAMAHFASNEEFNNMMARMGLLIGESVRPALVIVTKLFKALFKIFKGNDKLLEAVVKGLVALLGAVIGLFIMAKLGFIISLVSASLITMTAQAWVGASSLLAVAKGAFVASLKFLPFMLIVFAAVSIIAIFTDKVEGELIPILGTLATVAGGLGIAMLAPKTSIGLITKLLGGLGSALASTSVGAKLAGSSWFNFGEILKKPFKPNLDAVRRGEGTVKDIGTKTGKGYLSSLGSSISGGAASIAGKLSGFWKGLGKGGPILAAVAAAALLITAFIVKMEKDVEGSTIFKTKLVDKWQQVGMRMTAATNVFLRNLSQMFVELGTGIVAFFGDVANRIGTLAAGIGDAILAGLNPFDDRNPFEIMREAWDSAFKDFELTDTLGDIFDPTGVSGFTRELVKQLKVLEEAGFNRTDAVVASSIAELIDAWKIAAEDFGSQDIAAILDSIFGNASDQFIESEAQQGFDDQFAGEAGTTGNDVFQDEEVQAKMDELDAIAEGTEIKKQDNLETQKKVTGTKTMNEIQKVIAKLTEEQKKHMLTGIDNAIAYGVKLSDLQKELLRQNTATKDATSAENLNTKVVGENTINSVADSKSMLEHVDFLKMQIVEVAKNINAISSLTTMISRVEFTFARIMAEGNRFAGKLASAWMDSEGKWHYRDPGISDSDAKAIDRAGQNFASTAGNQVIINIEELKNELAKIQGQLDEANQIASESQTTIKEANEAATTANANANQSSIIGDFNNAYNNPNYADRTRLLRDEDGRLAIDINIDETIDIVVENGHLSPEQVIELTNAVGGSVADQIKEAIQAEL
jgi:hypothetical protein